jgi:hypothetical protein
MPPPGAEALGEGVGVQKSVRAPRPRSRPAPVGRDHHGASASAKRSVGAIAAQAGRLATSHHNRNAPAWSERFLRHKSANLGRGGNSPVPGARGARSSHFVNDTVHYGGTVVPEQKRQSASAPTRFACGRPERTELAGPPPGRPSGRAGRALVELAPAELTRSRPSRCSGRRCVGALSVGASGCGDRARSDPRGQTHPIRCGGVLDQLALLICEAHRDWRAAPFLGIYRWAPGPCHIRHLKPDYQKCS